MRPPLLSQVILTLAASILLPFAAKADSPTKKESGPILFFTKADLPALQQKIKTPEYASEWAAILKEAQSYCDPKSPKYVDPVKYKTDLESGKFTDVVYSRQISGWVEVLGFAYQMTGDPTFGREGASLLESTARYLGPESKPMQKLLEGNYGDMMHGLAVGLDFLSGAMTAEQRSVITDTARRYLVRHIETYVVNRADYLMPHNFSGVCGGAIGMLAVALREDYPNEILLGSTPPTSCAQAGSRPASTRRGLTPRESCTSATASATR